MSTELRISTNQLSEFGSHSRQQQHISRSRKVSVNEHTPRRTRNSPVLNVNNNINLRFDMRTHNKGNITAQEDDEEKDSNQEHNNRGLMDCVEPSSDENVHSNEMVGN